MVEQHALGSLAYYYKGVGSAANEDAISSIILGTRLLTARGIPVAGEYEVKNVQAMKIMDSFGVGGSFTEYYAMDFNDDVVLMGHDGPGHIAIAQGNTKVRPLQVYHGKVGRGLSVEMSVQTWPRHASFRRTNRRRQSRIPHRRRRIRPRPDPGNRQHQQPLSVPHRGAPFCRTSWNAKAPAHHCAIGVGHIAHKLEKLGALLNINVIRIC